MASEVTLEAALQAVMEPGDIILQAVAVVVFMDEEGGKFLSHLRSTDLRSWEARGLVQDYADTLTALEVVRQQDGDDD